MPDGDGYQSYAQRYVPRYQLPVKFSVCVPVFKEGIYMPVICYMYLVELIILIRIGLSPLCLFGIFRNIIFTLVYLDMGIFPVGILLL